MTTSIVGQYVKYFNKSRNADIKGIYDSPDEGIIIRYQNGSEVVADVLTYVQLFDKLDALHPSHSDTPNPTKHAVDPAKLQERAS